MSLSFWRAPGKIAEVVVGQFEKLQVLPHRQASRIT